MALHVVGRFADGNRARDVGGSVLILRAAVDQEQLFRLDLAIGRVGDAVVHDRAVRAGARDRREADFAQHIRLAAKRFELAHGGNLVERAARCVVVEPGEEARHRISVADVSGARSGDFGFRFDRLRQDAGILSARDRGGTELHFEPEACGLWIEADFLSLRLECGDALGHRLRRQQFRDRRDMCAGLGIQSLRIDIEFGLAGCGHDGECEDNRIVRDVAATNVEQPADRIRQRENCSVLAVRFQASLNVGELIRCRAARERQRLCDDWVRWRFRPRFSPERIDWIFWKRFELDLLGRQGCLEACDLACRMVPGIEADRLVLAEGAEKPFRHSRAREERDFEYVRVGFGFRLHGVAAIDQQQRGLLRHDGKAGGAGKSRQPLQALGAGGNVFALMAIGARHKHGVELCLGHQRAKRFGAFRDVIGSGLRLECLKHDDGSRRLSWRGQRRFNGGRTSASTSR